MKIPAEWVLCPNRINGTRHSVAIIRLTTVLQPSWMQEDTHGTFEILMLSMFQTSQVLTSINNRISPHYFLLDMTDDSLIEMNMTYLSKWEVAPAWYSHSALCKLSFALVNDKLQEAEYDKQRLPKAGARTVFSKWYMTLFSRAEPFL